jgi:dipeptidyl aminopeptidase/acylaminoacyl peptidase
MGPKTVDELHWLLGEVRRRFGIERFYFVGGSMGGAAVLTYAVLHPDDVRAIVSLCPVTDVARFHAELMNHTAAIMVEIRRAIEDAHGGPPSEALEVYAAHSAHRHADRLTMPLLLVHAEGDAAVPVEESRQLAAALKGKKDFTYVEMPGGNHDTPLSYAPMWDWLGAQLDADALG